MSVCAIFVAYQLIKWVLNLIWFLVLSLSRSDPELSSWIHFFCFLIFDSCFLRWFFFSFLSSRKVIINWQNSVKVKVNVEVVNIKFRQLRNNFRRSHTEVFLRKGVLKTCSKFTGGHPCRSGITLRHGCSQCTKNEVFH